MIQVYAHRVQNNLSANGAICDFVLFWILSSRFSLPGITHYYRSPYATNGTHASYQEIDSAVPKENFQ
eukprot:3754359-Rhodomonas_salina.1